AERGAWCDDERHRQLAAPPGERDISKFNPKAPPPKTPAFWDIVDAGRAPEEGELADVLDEMGRPSTVTLSEIRAAAVGEFLDWLQDRKNRRVIPRRMGDAGYVAGNPAGRKPGDRNKFGTHFISDFYADWVQHGAAAIEKLRLESPKDYVKVAASLLPRELHVKAASIVDGWTEDEVKAALDHIR